MTRKMMIFFLAIGLSACGGGGGGGSTPIPAPAPEPEGSQVLLVPAGSAEAFNDYMVNSLELWGGLAPASESLEEAIASPFPQAAVAQVPLPEDAINQLLDAGALAGFERVTGTNVLVTDVDEIDAAKYNGSHLFLANNQHLTVLEAGADGEPETVANLRLIETNTYAQLTGLYLHETDSVSHLVAIRGGGFFFLTDAFIEPWPWQDETVIDFIDVDSPANPNPIDQFVIDGNHIQSRRVGNTLYVITRFSPAIDGFVPFARDDETRQANADALAETDQSTFVPHLNSARSGETDLVDAGECLIPNQSVEDLDEALYPTLTTITAINIETQSVTDSICMADGVWGIHMTETALYVAAPSRTASSDSYYAETTFHKFALQSSAIEYRGSGTVSGGFWGDPAFLMGEHDGNLTVITTEDGDANTTFVHRLSILAESSEDLVLDVVGSIPNDNRPEPIGKPNEQIFASRILGDRAYVVTFERIDPVYAIDLSNASDPRILGELEIPGFSSYLHPVSEDLILGVGSDTRMVGDFVVPDAINIRLFDVADPANIQLAAETSIGRQGSITPVFYDYHAFTFLETGDNAWRFALPITRRGAHQPEPDEPDRFGRYAWTDTALHLFEITGGPNPSMSAVGKIVAEDHTTGERHQTNCCSWQDRSFFNGDEVYYLSKSRLFNANWSTPTESTNTFIQTLFAGEVGICTEVFREPLSVNLFDRSNGDFLSCGPSIFTDPAGAADGTLVAEPCDEPTITTSEDIVGPGSYDVTAMLEGYTPLTVTDVRIQADACRFGTTWLNLYLEAE